MDGGVVSTTVMLKEPLATFPERSDAEQFTVVVPSGKTDPEGGVQTTGTGPSTASIAVAVKVTVAPLGPVASTTLSDGRVSTGGVVSPSTVMVNEPTVMPPPALVAVQLTVVGPMNVEPEGGLHTTVAPASVVTL